MSLDFYKIMGYPFPYNIKCFDAVDDIYSFAKKKNSVEPNFSRKDFEENKFLQKYIKKINKYGWLFKNLPFVKQIRFSNSITFGVIKECSDIDFLIICKKDRLFLCRFFSILILIFFNLIWIRKKKGGKIDLNFFVDEDNINLYNISLKPIDWYLIYWIAHLVLLYSENKKEKSLVFEKNKRIKQVLVNHPLKQCINLGNFSFFGKGCFKELVERLLDNIIGDFFENILRFIWIPVMIYKKSKLGEKGWGIIISNKILKFHGKDIRKKVNLLMKVAGK